LLDALLEHSFTSAKFKLKVKNRNHQQRFN